VSIRKTSHDIVKSNVAIIAPLISKMEETAVRPGFAELDAGKPTLQPS
jgi:hypothetical protein